MLQYVQTLLIPNYVTRGRRPPTPKTNQMNLILVRWENERSTFQKKPECLVSLQEGLCQHRPFGNIFVLCYFTPSSKYHPRTLCQVEIAMTKAPIREGGLTLINLVPGLDCPTCKSDWQFKIARARLVSSRARSRLPGAAMHRRLHLSLSLRHLRPPPRRC